MRLRNIAAAAALLALAACLGGPRVPERLLTLTAETPLPAAAPRSAAQGEGITVVEPTVPQALRTPRVPVYISETGIQYLRDAQWVENPGALFGRLVGEVIAVRTGRVVLDPRQYTHDPGTRLTGQLQRFGLDPATMEAVVVYDAAIARLVDGVQTGLVTNRFEARVPVAEATPAAVAPALNRAANQVAEQVAAWIGG